MPRPGRRLPRGFEGVSLTNQGLLAEFTARKPMPGTGLWGPLQGPRPRTEVPYFEISKNPQ